MSNSPVTAHLIILKLLDIIPFFDECRIVTSHTNYTQRHDHMPKRKCNIRYTSDKVYDVNRSPLTTYHTQAKLDQKRNKVIRM